MKYFFLSLLIITLAIFVFSPFIAKADDFCKSGIVPCGRNCDNPDTEANETKPCTLCHFIVGIWKLIDYGFKIIVFLALTGLVIAGIMYIVSAGSEELIKTAKTFMKSILYGFAIVLAAWLLIFVVMNYLGAKPGRGLGVEKEGWNKFKCSTESSADGGKTDNLEGNGDNPHPGMLGAFFVSYPSLAFILNEHNYVKNITFYVSDNENIYTYNCSISPSDLKAEMTSATVCEIKGVPNAQEYTLTLSAAPKSGSGAPAVDPQTITIKAAS